MIWNLQQNKNIGRTCVQRSHNSDQIFTATVTYPEFLPYTHGLIGVAKDAKFLYADNEDWSDNADAQDNLSLRWAQISDGTCFMLRLI